MTIINMAMTEKITGLSKSVITRRTKNKIFAKNLGEGMHRTIRYCMEDVIACVEIFNASSSKKEAQDKIREYYENKSTI